MSPEKNVGELGEDDLLNIIKLRLAVGLLGEKDHGNSWPSLWLTSNALAFLTPIYGDRIDAARYQGIVEAARIVHDDRIGVGQAYHLFRLPEAVERRLHDAVTKENAIKDLVDVTDQQSAQRVLVDLATDDTEPSRGPIRVGSIRDLKQNTWLGLLASQYRSAFQISDQTFPYFSERQ